MQTFLPYADFARTAACLDYRRLGKQRVECLQIINALTVEGAGWRNHPATLMWQGHLRALMDYQEAIIEEWVTRGYKNTMAPPRHLLRRSHTRDLPSFIGSRNFHRSHRSNLLRKDPVHYGQFKWNVPHDLEYVWPVRRA